jgi:hypothetical protein
MIVDCENVCSHEYNIIGHYKLNKIKKTGTPAPWIHFKNDWVEETCTTNTPSSSDSDNDNEKLSNRDKGFSILSNRKNVITYLKNTKFCKLLIEQGKCSREVCNFAHSIEDIVFPVCAFEDGCTKKETCHFRHPTENIDDYKTRIRFTIPRNITSANNSPRDVAKKTHAVMV